MSNRPTAAVYICRCRSVRHSLYTIYAYIFQFGIKVLINSYKVYNLCPAYVWYSFYVRVYVHTTFMGCCKKRPYGPWPCDLWPMALSSNCTNTFHSCSTESICKLLVQRLLITCISKLFKRLLRDML